jgi:D-alanyl-D-alanine carboxypeptidase/D-alanyl-D-alanine-endopeptidase (penicillin-binding protein 4)
MRSLARRAAVLFVLAAGLGLGARAEAGRVVDLAAALEARMRRCQVAADRVGIAVLELGKTPRVVFAQGHTQSLPTASVAKLFTAAAALDLLGPGHVFATTLTARGEVDGDGVLHGDLVVHGSGDPNLSGRLFGGAATHVLDRLAGAAREAGIRVVRGALVLDDAPFDRVAFHPDWRAGDRAKWYGAPVGGLSFNDSCVDLVVRGASRPGREAVVDAPATTGAWSLENRVETIASGDTVVHAAWGERDVLSVVGKAPVRGSYSFSVPVPDPARFFGGAFARSLAAAGVRVEGGVRLARSEEDRRPGREVARHATALSTSLRVMNKRSQNFYAGCLFKACGAHLEGEGTWASGERAVAEMLRRRRLADEGRTTIVDGSGLSLKNQAAAATVALLLARFAADPLRGPLLRDSLAVPGEEGTLDDRYLAKDVRGRLRAKTGTLARSGVHALAGYLDGRGAHPGYAFAILVRSGAGARELMDGVVEEIAGS